MRATLALFLTLAVPIAATAQDGLRPLTHDDYDSWKSIRGTAYSADGKWIAYTVAPAWGDGELRVRHVENGTRYEHPRGTSATFTADARYVVFSIGESVVEEREKRIRELAEKGKVKSQSSGGGSSRAEEMRRRFGGGGGARRGGSGGKGDLGILDLTTGQVEIVENVKGFRVPEDSSMLVYHFDEPEKDDEEKDGEEGEASGESEESKEAGAEEKKPAEAKATEEKTAEKKTAEKKAEPGESSSGERRRGRRGGRKGAEKEDDDEDPLKKKRKDGTQLVVRDLGAGTSRTIDHVVGYGLTAEGKWLYYHCSKKELDDAVPYGLHALQLGTDRTVTLVAGAAEFSGYTVDEEATGFAFLSNKEDFAAEKPLWDLYLWDFSDAAARRIVHQGTASMPENKKLARSGVSFSKDGSVLTFSIDDPEEEDPKILPEDEVKLDLWHWRDGMIQPMQAKRRSSDSWTCAYHRDDDRIVVLGDEQIPSMRLITPDGSRALASDNKPYEQRVQWDSSYSDIYLVNTIDGTRRKVLTELRGRPSTSPQGRYLIYFDTEYRWHAVDVMTLETRDLTSGLGVEFHRSDDDHPHPDPAHGVAGWTADDAEVVLHDEFDLWRIAPATGDAVCITDGLGRANEIRFRVQRLDRDEDHLPEELWLNATNTQTMARGIYTDSLREVGKPRRVVWFDRALGGLTKADKADRFFFTLESFREFPDIWTADMAFGNRVKLTDVGAQLDGIRWGDAELVTWASLDGKPLKGYLIKPDGFDPNKKWPMMVYFYERMSSQVHRHTRPSPGTSPNAAYYVSNGYLWFVPDIHYDVGYPGPSAVKCVVSGVQHLINQGFVDENAIGAAGHSWGGYQTAYLVTRTNIFKAVESGAPVSNMVSAYGGIRYGSGMSRQFQYEMTQSRIGGSLWQYPMRYWENSPIFFADKVQTPVLILHNDEDGAVPWTNGIEYFMALRRLGKEAYLFNYVGAGHGLRKRQNQKDWTRRMQEYFDHHLKGAPAPAWMTDGVDYEDRATEKLEHAASYHEVLAMEAKIEAEEKLAAAEKAEEAAAEATTAEAAATGTPAEPATTEAASSTEAGAEPSPETTEPAATGAGEASGGSGHSGGSSR